MATRRQDHAGLGSLAQLRRRYVDEGRPLPKSTEDALRSDARAGCAAILAAVERRRRDNRAEGQRLRTMRRFEETLWDAGTQHVAGIDEAGMSPLAGPVVAGAVILPHDFREPGVDDSKKLTAETRNRLAAIIKRDAVAWGVGMTSPQEIDDINIYRAGLLAMRRAVEALDITPGHLLIDARALRELPIPQQSIVKGDTKSLSIAAASIIAKTTRDRLMAELDARYPGYGFAKHKGYPVAEHVAALARQGACEIHRRSFAPVRKAMGLQPEQQELF